MRYFVAYHNAKKMGYSCTEIPVPRVKTRKPIAGLEGATVWLVSGEGESPKSYYLASRFVVEKCETDKHLGAILPNEISGTGVLLGTAVCLDSTALLKSLKRVTANFVNGLCELRDPGVVAELRSIA